MRLHVAGRFSPFSASDCKDVAPVLHTSPANRSTSPKGLSVLWPAVKPPAFVPSQPATQPHSRDESSAGLTKIQGPYVDGANVNGLAHGYRDSAKKSSHPPDVESDGFCHGITAELAPGQQSSRPPSPVGNVRWQTSPSPILLGKRLIRSASLLNTCSSVGGEALVNESLSPACDQKLHPANPSRCEPAASAILSINPGGQGTLTKVEKPAPGGFLTDTRHHQAAEVPARVAVMRFSCGGVVGIPATPCDDNQYQGSKFWATAKESRRRLYQQGQGELPGKGIGGRGIQTESLPLAHFQHASPPTGPPSVVSSHHLASHLKAAVETGCLHQEVDEHVDFESSNSEHLFDFL